MAVYNADIYSSGNISTADTVRDAELYTGADFLSRGIDTTVTVWSESNFFDSLSPEQIYFGFNFTQNIDFIYIKKSAFSGLTATANNTAESLLIGLLKRLFDVGEDTLLNISFSMWTTDISNGFITRRLLAQIYLPVSDLELAIDDFKDTILPNDL